MAQRRIIETYGHTIAGRRRRRHAWPILLSVFQVAVYPLLMTIVICSELNNLKLNTDKSKEMLVPKSGRWTVPEPPPLGMERVSELKILGVLFTNDLSVTSHVDDIISKCASYTYALRILRANGLQDNALFTVCNATTISRLLYA